jgi:hypothetical protein
VSAVAFTPGELHVTPAGELLREWVASELPARYRKLYDRILLMAGGKSNYLEDKIKNEVLGAVAFGAPANTYWGLWDGTALSDTAHGGTAGEVSGGSYDRVTMANNTTNFPTVTGTAKQNGVAVTWPQATADWNTGGAIEQLGVLDGNAKTSGDNLLIWVDFTVAKSVLNGDTAQIAINQFSWTED